MGVPNVMAIHPIVVETFHSKPQTSTSWWRGVKVGGSSKSSGYTSSTNHECLNHICANPSIDVEIFHRMSENSDLPVVLAEKSGDHQSQ